MNRGLVCQKDDWIYFSNISDEWKLYKMKVDGSNKTKLSDMACDNIIIQGDWIYFVECFYEGESGTLYKINKNGGDEIQVSEKFPSHLYMDKDLIYFINIEDDEYKIYIVKTDGTDEHRLSDNVIESFIIIDNTIYYKDYEDQKLHKMGKNGENSTLISEDTIEDFIIANNNIYWTDAINSNIYKFRTKDNVKEKICNDEAGYLNYLDGFVYYRNTSDSGKLYKISIDGQKRIELSEGQVENINVTKEWVYYENAISVQKLSRIRIDGSKKEDL